MKENEIKEFLNFVALDGEEKPVILDEVDDTVSEYVDTGCYALNYLLTRKIYAGFPLGRIITIAGDSASGKTAMALQFRSSYSEIPNNFLLEKYIFYFLVIKKTLKYLYHF